MEDAIALDKCDRSTLSESVDEYLINRGIDKKKHFGKFLVIAGRVWQDIFWNTLWVVKNVWLPLKEGHPYHYVQLPERPVRLFSVNRTDHCGKLVPLFYNNQLNVIVPPNKRCQHCDGGPICEDVNSMEATTKLLFTINGQNYYEKTWLKYCPNGDIWEYRQVPTKKFMDFTGDQGDYNDDYNDDYLTANGSLSNFTIVTETFQKILCKLDAKPCGCPKESPANEQLLLDSCGCFLPFFGRGRRCYCDPFLADPAPNVFGQVKMSECGTRIYFKPPVHRFQDQCNIGPVPPLPDFLNVSYQTDGKTLGQDILIPDFALMAHWTGIDWRSKLFNSRYPMSEKKGMEYQFNDQMNKIILFLNSFNMEQLSYIQDAPTRW